MSSVTLVPPSKINCAVQARLRDLRGEGCRRGLLASPGHHGLLRCCRVSPPLWRGPWSLPFLRPSATGLPPTARFTLLGRQAAPSSASCPTSSISPTLFSSTLLSRRPGAGVTAARTVRSGTQSFINNSQLKALDPSCVVLSLGCHFMLPWLVLSSVSSGVDMVELGFFSPEHPAAPTWLRNSPAPQLLETLDRLLRGSVCHQEWTLA